MICTISMYHSKEPVRFGLIENERQKPKWRFRIVASEGRGSGCWLGCGSVHGGAVIIHCKLINCTGLSIRSQV